MSIITKTGDAGKTGLYSGERVWKDDLRVEAYGTLDELDAHIGEAKAGFYDEDLRQLLANIQAGLYRAMGELASTNAAFPEPLTAVDVDELTELVIEYEQRVDLKGFVLPGSTLLSAKLDVCRTVSRRAERRIVALLKTDSTENIVLQYVNRLSDFFYILARWIEQNEDALTYINN